ncbi:MAG: hypothetical protein ACJ8DI_27870 [Ktedonobacteraceae bacterium]
MHLLPVIADTLPLVTASVALPPLVLLDLSPAGTSGHGMPRLKARRSSQRFSAR